MADKITLQTIAAEIAKLGATMEKGFAAVADDIAKLPSEKDVRAIVREMIVEHVPGIVALELKPMHEQLAQIEKRLDMLEEHYANLKGVTKEIDDIRSEIRAIQKHLGLDTKIAA